jgi:hypothetical protein
LLVETICIVSSDSRGRNVAMRPSIGDGERAFLCRIACTPELELGGILYDGGLYDCIATLDRMLVLVQLHRRQQQQQQHRQRCRMREGIGQSVSRCNRRLQFTRSADERHQLTLIECLGWEETPPYSR